MLTLIAGAILFFCSAYVGLAVKRHYKKRRDFFKGLVEFCELLTSEIAFLKTPLKSIITTFCTDRKGEFVDFLGAYSKMLECGKTCELRQKDLNTLKLLKATEREKVLAFFSALGKNDSATELKNIENFSVRFKSFLAESEKSFSTSGNLSFKLAVLLGIAIMIIVA